jgi:hypothetical protein
LLEPLDVLSLPVLGFVDCQGIVGK